MFSTVRQPLRSENSIHSDLANVLGSFQESGSFGSAGKYLTNVLGSSGSFDSAGKHLTNVLGSSGSFDSACKPAPTNNAPQRVPGDFGNGRRRLGNYPSSSVKIRVTLKAPSCDTLATDLNVLSPAMDLAPLPDGSPPVEVIAGLGAGGYACVCLVKPVFRAPGGASDDSELLAMKVVGKKIGARPKDRERLVTELKVLRDAAPSRFLQRCHGAFESATDVFFVCDYLAGGDLFFHMVRRFKEGRGAFSEPEARNVLAEVAVGLVHLHDRGFIHRDLKVENIMLDASGHVKLIDFGLSVEIDRGRAEQPMSPSGSLAYMPPELVRSERKAGGRHTDWWAFGVVTYELLTGRTPWSSLSDKPLIRQEIQFAEVQYPPSLSPEARTFLEALFERDFRRRLGTAHDHEVLHALFFQTVVWSAVERGDSAPPVHLDVIGPDVVNPVDGRNAMAAYLKKVELSGSSEFGMASSFYLGEDFVTAYPAVTGLTKLRAATGNGP